MHSVWTRGALVSHLALGVRRGLLDFEMWASQLGGDIGGCASAVVTRAAWRTAPVARCVARTLTFLGGLLGKVPGAARRALAHPGFLSFSRFQIDAEQTAVLAWSRVAELSKLLKRPHDARVAERVMLDEKNHARMFEAFVDVLDAHRDAAAGTTVEGVRCDAATLANRLEGIDPALVPAQLRDTKSPIGRGGVVAVAVAEAAADASDARATLRSALESAGVLEAVGDRLVGARVAVKTCFMMTYDQRDLSSHVRPDLVDDSLRVRVRSRRLVGAQNGPRRVS